MFGRTKNFVCVGKTINTAVLTYSVSAENNDDKYRLDDEVVVVPRDALIQWQVVVIEE